MALVDIADDPLAESHGTPHRVTRVRLREPIGKQRYFFGRQFESAKNERAVLLEERDNFAPVEIRNRFTAAGRPN